MNDLPASAAAWSVVLRAVASGPAEIMMRIAAEFGFTPPSRSRIATPSPEEPTLFDQEQPDESSA